MARTYTSTQTWPGYGLVAGSGVGVVLLALTGSVMWIVALPGAGLLVGLLAGSWRDHQSRNGSEHKAG